MKLGLDISLNLSKIDKTRITTSSKGEKFLNINSFIDTDNQDQYGNNGMIVHKVSKEEKQQGVRGGIIGNTKVFWKDEQSQPQQQIKQDDPQFDDGMPF